MSIVVETLRATPIAERRVELVERKGLGHPDTICDHLVEAASIALNRLYLERLGGLAHYNIDKALLVAGQCDKHFGFAKMTQAMELIIGDRATLAFDGSELPIEDTIREAIAVWIDRHLPKLDPRYHLETQLVLAPGSAELRSIFSRGKVLGANDTSGASGYAPLTPTEKLVLAVEAFLNGPRFKVNFPDTGEDVKVFAARRDEHVDVTVAMPFCCAEIGSEREYFNRKREALAVLKREFRDRPFDLAWALNCLDRQGAGSDGAYLTLTGTSAEDGDSGQVGRGNRANGLISFARPCGNEAAAGKNPLAHTGKIYSLLSHRIARLIHEHCPMLKEVYVHLASRIGDPVERPWSAIQIVPAQAVESADLQPVIDEIVERELEHLPEFQRALMEGEYEVC